MIKVFPEIELSIPCPFCKRELVPHAWHHIGMRVVLSVDCKACKKEFISEAPINSGLFYPGIIEKESGKRMDDLPFENWYLSGFQKAFSSIDHNPVNVDVIKNHELGKKPVLLLNTIDATYGHALYELFNASFYLKNEAFDLVIIVQKNLAWLVPEGAAQVWVCDISFGRADRWIERLDDEIKKFLENCSEVFLCRSFVQADSLDFNIEEYAKRKPFPLDEWDQRLEKPTVTFIWRTDRFWRRTIPRVIDNRYSRKLFPSLLKKLNNYFQFKWILRFSERLKKQIPNIDFAIAGMDERKPDLPTWIKDFRYPTHQDETARLQVNRYAESHIVLGCNGSSLLLPGCLSGGVIDIVPGEQWAVSAGTFPFRITSIGDTHFRYVLLPCEVTIDRLINVLISVLRDRSYVQIQTSPPWRDHKASLSPYDWKVERIRAFEVSKHFNSKKGLISVPKTSK